MIFEGPTVTAPSYATAFPLWYHIYTGDGIRVPVTEICLLPAEFDEYQIGVDASVTFCLRELRVHYCIVLCVCAEWMNSYIIWCVLSLRLSSCLRMLSTTVCL